ncbi:unnamed protein product, partial [Sphacelaria rigidula]
LVPATKFLALVAAAEAIAELVRAEADLVVAVAAVARNPTARDGAQRNRRKDRGGDVDGDDDHDDSGDNDNDAVAERPSRGKNKGTSGSKYRLKRRKRGGAGPDQTGATAATARDIVLMEATRRTRSEWAWQRELSFLLIETCGGDAGADGGDLGDAGEGVGGERCNDVQQAARAAVDRVLAGTEDVGGGVDGGSNGSGGGKVFRELKRVDDTVGAACTGVISLLLQDTPTGNADGQTAPSPAACATTASNTETDHPPSQINKKNTGTASFHSTSKKKTRDGARKRAQRGSSGSGSSSAPPTPTPATETVAAPPNSALSSGVERMFRILAASFGETIVPLDRTASHAERHTVWRERIAHFQERMREQQNILETRIAAAAAAAHVATRPLPQKLNPVLRPLVSAVKIEPDPQRRARSAIGLAHLAATLIADDSHSTEEPRRRSAGGKVLMNLAILAKPQSPP